MLLTLKNWFNPADNPQDVMNKYVKSGNNKLLQQLISLYADDLYHYLISQSDAELAKDISQKTWLKVIDKREYYQDKGNFKAWLFTLARNALLDEFRKTNRFEQFINTDEIIDTQFSNDSDDLEKRFANALLLLPFEQREAFVLQQEDFSIQQIADITAQKPETIKTRLRYAKKQLKQHLGG